MRNTTQKKRQRKILAKGRKNPAIEPSPLGSLDYKFLKEIGISIPVGIPDDPDNAKLVGALIGEKYILELCDKDPLKTFFIFSKVKQRFPQFNFNNIDSLSNIYNRLPSEAFQYGLIYGIAFGLMLCQKYNSFERQNTLGHINESLERSFPNLIYSFEDIKLSKSDKTKEFLKLYFGLNRRKNPQIANLPTQKLRKQKHGSRF